MRTDYSKVEAGEAFLQSGTSNGMPTQNHADQGVIIQVRSRTRTTKPTSCSLTAFSQPTYTYDPDGRCKICQIDPIADGNPIGWSVKQLKTRSLR